MSIHSNIYVIYDNPRWMVVEFISKIIFKKEKENQTYSIPKCEACF